LAISKYVGTIHDIQTQGDMMVGFVNMHILMPQESEGAKMVKRNRMHYLH
jgi:hypothetical protein